MDFQSHRPVGFLGQGDQYLPEAIRNLKRALKNAQRSLRYDTLRMSSAKLEEVAHVLVEFAEDVHNDIGIWRSVEEYNLDFFGTRLPLVPEVNDKKEQRGIHQYRVRHFLWVFYSELIPELVLSPSHHDLCLLAEQVADFLKKQFASIPRDSGIKAFLTRPNEFGWDVKRKLIWLGTHSYLLRNSFRNYIENQGGKTDLTVVDDFVCQQTTSWSGLGIIDILAGTLNLAEKQRGDLRSWYDRHTAYYRVLHLTGPTMEVENVVNGKPYSIRVGEKANQFKVGQIILGSLVPWGGEWYWSGSQSVLDGVSEDVLRQLRSDFLQETPTIAYRYCDEIAEKAREKVKDHYRGFVEYHGDDLVVYPDGLSMAGDLQKQQRLKYESPPSEVVSSLMKKHNLPGASPRMSFPPELIEDSNGIGVYFNPEEGLEITRGFNTLVNGFKKQGIALTEDEENAIRSFFLSKLISPRFVGKLIQQYGDESVAAAFLIRSYKDKSYVDYLLRRHKGHFYRKRYPYLTFV